ncbi:hypothetical protein GCM10010517_39580 [Streptosporangium fragile]|uniref:Uncharacterized protein n=1 Tax=Streptosporangium fragile TaxID=46186 RepID=A0ABP6II39_9ACTN
MSDPRQSEGMPGGVRAARWMMWAQVVLGALGFLLLLGVLLLSGMPGIGALPGVMYLYPVAVILVGALSAGFASRRRWVRLAGIGIEGAVILDRGYSLATSAVGVNLLVLLDFSLAVIVLTTLSGAAARRWFSR